MAGQAQKNVPDFDRVALGELILRERERQFGKGTVRIEQKTRAGNVRGDVKRGVGGEETVVLERYGARRCDDVAERFPERLAGEVRVEVQTLRAGADRQDRRRMSRTGPAGDLEVDQAGVRPYAIDEGSIGCARVHRYRDAQRVVTTTGLFIAAALLNGCIIDSSDESVSNSHLVFSYSVTDSQDDESLMIAARVTSRAGLVFFPVNLVGADRLILVGEGGEAEFERSEEPGEYFGAFDAPVRADRWEYRVDLIRQGRRLTTAALDLRTRPTDFVLTYDDEESALQASCES